jgi:predicted ATP-dependent endonuclease of OLD family
MKLIKFRVTKFRSIQDSGWIDIDFVNALLGENESGKTNILLPLWKLKPSSNGEIDLLADAPRNEYSRLRELPNKDKPIFISAIFDCNDIEQFKFAEIAKCDKCFLKTVEVSRRYDGHYIVNFPDAKPRDIYNIEDIKKILEETKFKLEEHLVTKTETKFKSSFTRVLGEAIQKLSSFGAELKNTNISEIIEIFTNHDLEKAPKKGKLAELMTDCLAQLENLYKSASQISPNDIEELCKEVQNLMPTFIYYSNYGNLDSEIYLPNIIRDLNRSDLGEKNFAKTRTLKVLFEFVKLKPDEILELGKDLSTSHSHTDVEIELKSKQKKERNILLESASNDLTKSFKSWWKQGDYNFRFSADGDHFRIWVSDSIRTEQIELENRSTGLQWFFSFFLVFLNEKNDKHFGSILLLDEPGVTLHPMAQKDLFNFFENLSKDNQLIYTTHSPFLMNPDKLDQVKAVYVGQDGYSNVSSDLRVKANSVNNSEYKAIYPVHSALGLTISEVLFIGCKILLVEGPSDQYYLSAIKNILIFKEKLNSSKELLFIPAGGTKGIKSTSKILSFNEDNYPCVLLDSDSQGIEAYKSLVETTYAGRVTKIIQIKEFINIINAEIEDFVDPKLIANVVTRSFKGINDFEDIFNSKLPIVPQIEAYCKENSINLPQGWKVELSRNVKKKMIMDNYIKDIEDETINRWSSLFNKWIENF